MDIQELNEFIGRYLKYYKTKSAIMLKGEWGIGKSFYIQNYLIPYITDKVKRYSCISIRNKFLYECCVHSDNLI